jgi:hypothetical protein
MTADPCHRRWPAVRATVLFFVLAGTTAAAQAPAPTRPAALTQPAPTTAVARFTPPPLPFARPVFTPRDPDGIYAVGDTVAWTATMPAGETPAPVYTYKIRKNNQDLLEIGTLEFAGGRATIDVVPTEPMFVYVEVSIPGYEPGRPASSAPRCRRRS